jgi:hypothetical protein
VRAARAEKGRVGGVRGGKIENIHNFSDRRTIRVFRITMALSITKELGGHYFFFLPGGFRL